MASIFQELQVGEAILADVGAFAAGGVVQSTQNIAGQPATVTIVLLPGGPAAPYSEIAGSFFQKLAQAFVLGSAFFAGAQVQLAVKEGNTWYGLTLQAVQVPIAPSDETQAPDGKPE